MTYDSLIQMLIDSRPEDWLRNEDEKVWTLKRDLCVTVRERREEHVGTHDEPWAMSGIMGRLLFGSSRCGTAPRSFVGKYNFAAVDGGQALLPYPKSSDDLRITRVQLAIAIAVNRQDDSLHRYSTWPESWWSSRNSYEGISGFALAAQCAAGRTALARSLQAIATYVESGQAGHSPIVVFGSGSA